MIHLAFFTGARSEYGLARGLLSDISSDKRFSLTIIVSGMHLLKSYGFTVNEIRQDKFGEIIEIPTLKELSKPKEEEFAVSLTSMSALLKELKPDVLFVVGDRPEAYSAALAGHFSGIPIAHSGGGQITEGAVDNIYRYNISNLSTVHFATTKLAQKRLAHLPVTDPDSVFFVGALNTDDHGCPVITL